MYSDQEEDATEVDGEESHDKALEEMWSRKQRRRSSDLKIIRGDKLKLQYHAKMVVLATKNG